MARPKGSPKFGGRVKGTPNKVTLSVREAITAAFEQRGGVKALLEWADTNPDAFYAHLWGRLAPREVVADVKGQLDVIIRNEAAKD